MKVGNGLDCTSWLAVDDDAHDAFMTLPPYNAVTRKGMGSSIGGNGPNPCWRAFA